MYLFLDDLRLPCDVKWVELPKALWVIVRNYDQFIKYILDNGMPKFVAFDHDLADCHYAGDFSKEKTGLDCTKWLVEYCMQMDKPFPEYVVHSMNIVGKENIISYIENFKRIHP